MATYSNLSNPVFDVLMCLSKFHSTAIINSITDTNWKDVEKDIKLDRSEAHGKKAVSCGNLSVIHQLTE